jgi:hypothetical protein
MNENNNDESLSVSSSSTTNLVVGDVFVIEEKEPLFIITPGIEKEQHEPFGLLGMQQAYWIGQQYITSLLQQQSYEEEDGEPPYYSPHVYLEYDIHVGSSKDSFDYNLLEFIVNTMVKRHGKMVLSLQK